MCFSDKVVVCMKKKKDETNPRRDAQIVIKSAEGRTVTVSDEAYEEGRQRLLKAGMLNVRKRK